MRHYVSPEVLVQTKAKIVIVGSGAAGTGLVNRLVVAALGRDMGGKITPPPSTPGHSVSLPRAATRSPLIFGSWPPG
ncbi:hypothetical protein AB4874_13245 [Thioclava sp. 15-R06ZXC-3]|uniref:THIF-type NAD/FAD binding fold domain-containing protein n=1 Tax=Thioclava arctica TaxID=3238301 RepID=A0ABV3TMX2_9RHOB